MSGILLPGGKEHKVEATPKVEDLTPEQQQALEDLAARENPEDHYEPVATAFTVILDRNGSWSISPSINLPIVVDREPTATDFIAGTEVVSHDVKSHVEALKVQAVLQQMQQQAIQTMQHKAIQDRLNLPKR